MHTQMETYTYNECNCRHFFTPTYNREILTREDHLNLLATPKGYRWYGPDGDLQIRKRSHQWKNVKQKPPPQPFPGFQQFMVEIWSVLTPEMIDSLRQILEEEFGLSPAASLQFLQMQKEKAERLAEAEALGPCRLSDDDIGWARTMARAIAAKMISYTEMMATTRKSRRTKLLHRNVLQGLQRVLGITSGDDTSLKKLMARLAEGLAVWLSSIPGENRLENVCTDLISLYSSVNLDASDN